jgi:hypothetical protein
MHLVLSFREPNGSQFVAVGELRATGLSAIVAHRPFRRIKAG